MNFHFLKCVSKFWKVRIVFRKRKDSRRQHCLSLHRASWRSLEKRGFGIHIDMKIQLRNVDIIVEQCAVTAMFRMSIINEIHITLTHLTCSDVLLSSPTFSLAVEERFGHVQWRMCVYIIILYYNYVDVRNGICKFPREARIFFTVPVVYFYWEPGMPVYNFM